MPYEIFEGRPEPYDPGQRARAERQSTRAPFNQELYDALKETLKGGHIRLRIPEFSGGLQPVLKGGDRLLGNAVDQGVRRRLCDKEGYGIKSERIDEEFCGVWLKAEVLWCSATKQQFVVPEWVEREGWRRRRGYRSPYDPTGVLVISLDKLQQEESNV